MCMQQIEVGCNWGGGGGVGGGEGGGEAVAEHCTSGRPSTITGLDWWTGLVDWTTGLTNLTTKMNITLFKY